VNLPGVTSRPRLAALTVSVLGGTAVLTGCGGLSSPQASRHAVVADAQGCPTLIAASRASRALAAAERRYLTEAHGAAIHADLRRIASDPVLLDSLSAGNLGSALAEANRQLVRHVVQIRVLRGSRLLVDANPTSWDVGGSGVELHAPNGRSLGRLEITVQDVIGLVKLIHKLNAAEVVVRGASGRVRVSLPATEALTLPLSGCTQVGTHSYVVSSFHEKSFTGEPLTVWVLTAA
jgi:hypothetical protein